MDKSNLHLNKSIQLTNRVLHFDGDSTVDVEFLYGFLLSGNKIEEHRLFVDELTDEIQSYNDLFDHKLCKKEQLNGYDYSWNIPKKYRKMNVKKFIMDKLTDELSDNEFSDSEMTERIKRVKKELKLWKKFGMFNLLKTLIYVIGVFNKNDVVWGTGRGSSCCCYVLYLIGLHDVDSVLYDLDLKEFFR